MSLSGNTSPVEHCVTGFAMFSADSDVRPSVLEAYPCQETHHQPHFVYLLSSSALWAGQGMATSVGRIQTLMESLMRSYAALTRSAAR